MHVCIKAQKTRPYLLGNFSLRERMHENKHCFIQREEYTKLIT